MTISFNKEAQATVWPVEEQTIHDEFDEVQVRKSDGRGKKLHIYDCDYLETFDIETIEKDMACYPVGWADLCSICVRQYRAEKRDLDANE